MIDGVRAGLEGEPEPLLTLPERVRRPLPFRLVLHHHEHPPLAPDLHRSRRDQDVPHRAPVGAVPGLELLLDPAQDARGALRDRPGILVLVEVRHLQLRELLARVAGLRGRPIVEREDAPPLVVEEDTARRQGEEGSIQRLARRERLLGLLPPCDVGVGRGEGVGIQPEEAGLVLATVHLQVEIIGVRFPRAHHLPGTGDERLRRLGPQHLGEPPAQRPPRGRAAWLRAARFSSLATQSTIWPSSPATTS